MSDYLKSIYSLIRLKYKIFKNTIFKSENWSKIIAIILLMLVFFNTLQSSAFIVQYVQDNFKKDSVLYRPLFEIILIIIFIVNIISTLTLSGSDYSRNYLRTLFLYPIKFNRIIFYEIINSIADIINVLYLPLYAVAIFLSDFTVGWINALAVLIIFLLLLLSISNIIYLLRNTIGLISFTKDAGKFIMLISFTAGFTFMIIIKQIPGFLSNSNNLINAASYLELAPTSMYTTLLLGSSSNFFYNFIIGILYFAILNFLLFLLNIYCAKLLKKKSYGKTYQKFSTKKSILTKLFINSRVNPFSKKDVAYTLRSIRTMPSHLMILFFVVIILFISLKQPEQNSYKLSEQFSISFLFLSLIVLSFLSNIFAFEADSIINYFIRPVTNNSLLKNKMLTSNFYYIIISVVNLIVMLILKTKFLDIMFFEIVFLLGYLFLLIISFPLSIYFPKKVSFEAMSGFLTSLISLFIFSVLTFVSWVALYLLFQLYLKAEIKFVFILSVLVAVIPFIYYRENILSVFGAMLSQRKEKIIQVFK
jgi:hypothetical protein